MSNLIQAVVNDDMRLSHSDPEKMHSDTTEYIVTVSGALKILSINHNIPPVI